jgi:hypothetical protein
VGGEIFRTRPDRSWGLQTSDTMCTGFFPVVKRSGRVFGHPPLLAPKMKNSKALPLLPLWAFVACFRAKCTFTCVIKACESETHNNFHFTHSVSTTIVAIGPHTLVFFLILITFLKSAEVTNTWSWFFTPPSVFTAFCLVKNRGDFTYPRRLKRCQCLAFAVGPRFDTLPVICYHE